MPKRHSNTASMVSSFPTMVRIDQYSSFPLLMPTLCIFKLGGRQVDGAIPSLLALEMIMRSPKIKAAQQSEKLTILFDSGIRTGSDIIKAMALGAQAVLCKFFIAFT